MFKEPIEQSFDQRGGPLLVAEEIKTVFGSLPDILEVHQSILVSITSNLLFFLIAVSSSQVKGELPPVTLICLEISIKEAGSCNSKQTCSIYNLYCCPRLAIVFCSAQILVHEVNPK